MVSVRLGVTDPGGDSPTWTGIIYSGTSTGGTAGTPFLTSQGFGTASPLSSSSNIRSFNLLVGGSDPVWDIDGVGGALFFIEIYHNFPATSYDLFWVEIITEVDSVEAALGLV
jgi:hypothetical protein